MLAIQRILQCNHGLLYFDSKVTPKFPVFYARKRKNETTS